MKIKKYITGIIILLMYVHQQVYGQQNNLKKILPKEYTAQYAGSTGFLSLGINYSLLDNYIDIGLLYGYVPKSIGGKLDILTLKFKFNPIEIKLGEQHKLYPFNPIFFLSTTLNENFYFRRPNHYSKEYYWWNSAMRMHVGFELEYVYQLSENHLIKHIGLYSNFNTNDLYLTAYINNKSYLSLKDIVKLGIGIKIGI
jgi:hypothetical protein